VYSWGWGDFGQLGQGKGASLTVPRELTALADKVTVSVATGAQHSALITGASGLRLPNRAL
jgi:alpha-tubulin suppressor-like RCC1 family protein